MDKHSAEARDGVWDGVKTGMIQLLATSGADVLTPPGTKVNSPVSAANIAQTYLRTNYGGSQQAGGERNTVIERTLKLLAHTLP